ncbi:hypothetical protein GCM10009662_60560 [Catellatospora coxensis]|uniref:Uncharacterized protein n=1 Tax=Catellatospora coxensis TaxID=310354 RepID=A0A8J3KXQ5_9ACTN|nr:hypothetical protein Cco03nite_47530 [Catellatospora coxensis]
MSQGTSSKVSNMSGIMHDRPDTLLSYRTPLVTEHGHLNRTQHLLPR